MHTIFYRVFCCTIYVPAPKTHRSLVSPPPRVGSHFPRRTHYRHFGSRQVGSYHKFNAWLSGWGLLALVCQLTHMQNKMLCNQDLTRQAHQNHLHRGAATLTLGSGRGRPMGAWTPSSPEVQGEVRGRPCPPSGGPGAAPPRQTKLYCQPKLSSQLISGVSKAMALNKLHVLRLNNKIRKNVQRPHKGGGISYCSNATHAPCLKPRYGLYQTNRLPHSKLTTIKRS